MKPIKLLFICLGNICRSPAAEAVFLKLSEDRNLQHLFDVDSAGTGAWHIGNPADPRSSAEGENRGYKLLSRARQVSNHDWEEFDYLICMDNENRNNLLRAGAPAGKVHLMMKWHPASELTEVPDPYYGGSQGFTLMYDLIESACEGLLDELTE